MAQGPLPLPRSPLQLPLPPSLPLRPLLPFVQPPPCPPQFLPRLPAAPGFGHPWVGPQFQTRCCLPTRTSLHLALPIDQRSGSQICLAPHPSSPLVASQGAARPVVTRALTNSCSAQTRDASPPTSMTFWSAPPSVAAAPLAAAPCVSLPQRPADRPSSSQGRSPSPLRPQVPPTPPVPGPRLARPVLPPLSRMSPPAPSPGASTPMSCPEAKTTKIQPKESVESFGKKTSSIPGSVFNMRCHF